MRVESIHLYPVKATRAINVAEAQVGLAGLRHDRRWAIVDLGGVRLNAASHDTLLAVTATPGSSGNLTLSAPGRKPHSVRVPVGGALIRVDVPRQPQAVDAGDAAADWFSEYLGEHVRLVWQDDPAKRPMSAERGGRRGDRLSLADAGPLLLTTTASLERLNDWIGADAEPIAMARFRPNVVIDGAGEPFAEDGWRRVKIGDVDYRFAEHCDRCVVTTIDPDTLRHGKEPIRTLSSHRKWEGKTWFGVRIVPLGTGTLAQGDAVSVGQTA